MSWANTISCVWMSRSACPDRSYAVASIPRHSCSAPNSPRQQECRSTCDKKKKPKRNQKTVPYPLQLPAAASAGQLQAQQCWQQCRVGLFTAALTARDPNKVNECFTVRCQQATKYTGMLLCRTVHPVLGFQKQVKSN